MSNDEHRNRISQLHDWIAGSSVNPLWGSAPETMADWQREALTRMHALTGGQQIEYLSSATVEGDDWDIVAFTANRVIRVLVMAAGSSAGRIETLSFARDTLESLELISVGPVPTDEDSWPTDLHLIGHYRAASIPLPLDRFSSQSNKGELRALLQSLLDDIAR